MIKLNKKYLNDAKHELEHWCSYSDYVKKYGNDMNRSFALVYYALKEYYRYLDVRRMNEILSLCNMSMDDENLVDWALDSFGYIALPFLEISNLVNLYDMPDMLAECIDKTANYRLFDKVLKNYPKLIKNDQFWSKIRPEKILDYSNHFMNTLCHSNNETIKWYLEYPCRQPHVVNYIKQNGFCLYPKLLQLIAEGIPNDTELERIAELQTLVFSFLRNNPYITETEKDRMKNSFSLMDALTFIKDSQNQLFPYKSDYSSPSIKRIAIYFNLNPDETIKALEWCKKNDVYLCRTLKAIQHYHYKVPLRLYELSIEFDLGTLSKIINLPDEILDFDIKKELLLQNQHKVTNTVFINVINKRWFPYLDHLTLLKNNRYFLSVLPDVTKEDYKYCLDAFSMK